MRYRESLCWKCSRATGGCPWSRYFRVVKGWDAVPTIIENDHGNIESFLVKSCPLYDYDGKSPTKPWINLFEIAAIVGISKTTIAKKPNEEIVELLRQHGISVTPSRQGKGRRFFYD